MGRQCISRLCMVGYVCMSRLHIGRLCRLIERNFQHCNIIPQVIQLMTINLISFASSIK